MSMEHGFTPFTYGAPRADKPSVPKEPIGLKTEKKESEPVFRETYELKDKKGNVLCTVRASFLDQGSVANPNLLNIKVRRLQNFQLVKNGKVIDVMELVGLKKGITMHVAPQIDKSMYFFNPDQRSAVFPNLDHSIGLAVALHELGHAKQLENSFYVDSGNLRTSMDVFVFKGMNNQKINEWFQEAGRFFPEMKAYAPSKERLEKRAKWGSLYGRLKERIEASQASLHTMTEKHSTFKTDLARCEQVSLGLDDFQRAIYQKNLTVYRMNVTRFESHLTELKTAIKDSLTVKRKIERRLRRIDAPILRAMKIPAKIMERDATRRAFQWMRQINAVIGVDLASTEVEMPEAEGLQRLYKKPNTCAESTSRVMDNIQKFGGISAKGALISALGSYDAFEKIPVPTRERLRELEEEEEKQKSSSS